MRRRELIVGSFAMALASAVPAYSSDQTLEYMPGDIAVALGDGKTVFVDYYASWCGTCKRQQRVVDQLRAEYPEYDDAMIFIKVDWDVYAGHEVSTSRNIPRRSTLLVLRGNEELGRIVAGTSKDEIKSLMDKGLSPDGSSGS